MFLIPKKQSVKLLLILLKLYSIDALSIAFHESEQVKNLKIISLLFKGYLPYQVTNDPGIVKYLDMVFKVKLHVALSLPEYLGIFDD
ncbi:hypothetical protein CEXT_434751 [Caerostris extrusa]|uniref:Uncharacterized protein n=1 Tax=Caerostris extrusa TaxID=172846 RepID=A0AAV4XDC3_CAEEX|nr:hypothetical protein CEXT_434751 [Caerostris extrusa]